MAAKSEKKKRKPAPMPKMKPVPIETRGSPWPIRIRRWLFSVRKWKITEDWEYQLPSGERKIVIPKGFKFDGASIPRILWGLLSPTGLLLIPGLVHDYAYQKGYLLEASSGGQKKIGEDKGRLYWDCLFARVARYENGFFFVIYAAWFGMVVFGWWPWLCYRIKEEEKKAGNVGD